MDSWLGFLRYFGIVLWSLLPVVIYFVILFLFYPARLVFLSRFIESRVKTLVHLPFDPEENLTEVEKITFIVVVVLRELYDSHAAVLSKADRAFFTRFAQFSVQAEMAKTQNNGKNCAGKKKSTYTEQFHSTIGNC